MDSKKQLIKLEKEMRVDHKKDIGFRYPSLEDKGSNYKDDVQEYEETLRGELHPLWLIDIFDSQHNWYLDNAQYQILAKKDKHKAIDYFGNMAAYGYLTLNTKVECFSCPNVPSQESVSIHTGTVMMAEILLCGWEEEYKEIGEWFIDSIAYGYQKKPESEGIYIHKIIISGDPDHLVGWFLLDLYCKVYHKTYDMKSAKYPKEMLFFSEIIDNWNTEDMLEVEKYVYLLSEYHLLHTQVEKADDDLFVFDHPDYWLFPVEILAWLKLREMNGLQNPREFSHPFMNTEVAQTFLNIKTPLAKPKAFPFVKELIENFKKKLCPDIKVPTWIE